MAKYAPVAPVEVLLQMKDRGFLDGYLLLLAHEVVNKPHQFKELLVGFKGTVILDNSLIELGVPVPMETMAMAAAIVSPNFVVLPDKLSDREATVNMSLEAIQQHGSKFPKDMGFMIAAQGKDPDDAMWCVESILKLHPKRNFLIGVPREITNTQGSRIPLVHKLTTSRLNVHLLGMSNNLQDDISCTKMFGVQGIDSASPLRAGWENLRYNGDTSKLRPRTEYFEQCRGFSINMAFNVGFIQGKIGEQ